MKKLLSMLMALVLVVISLLPAGATLTNSSTSTRYYSGSAIVDLYTALITAASNDTTANADSNVISNVGGDIQDISAGVIASNKTGTSPTLTVSFLGSYTNATGSWFALKTAQGSTAGTVGTLASSALDISTTDGTAANSVAGGISLSQFGLKGALLPPYIKVRIAVGGSASPGWTGVAYAAVRRGK